MDRDAWDRIKHFTRDENWGDPTKMRPDFLEMLDKVRDAFGHPFVIHCGFADGRGHAPQSMHYVGAAADFHIDAPILTYPAQIDRMLTVLADLGLTNKTGLGIYPDWNSRGFHLDSRGLSFGKPMARWGFVGHGAEQHEVTFQTALERATEVV